MSSSLHTAKPPVFGLGGLSTPAVGSDLTSLALTAQRNRPRIASRKLRACAGVLAGRSRPIIMVADVILANGCLPAVSRTCLKIFSLCRLVAEDRHDHAVVSRYRSISHASVPSCGSAGCRGVLANAA